MKWKYATGFILLAIVYMLCLHSNAEDNQQYLVYLKENNTRCLTSAGESGDHYSIMEEVELAECLSRGIVEFYEPDYEVELFDDPQTTSASNQFDQWCLEMIEADVSLELGCFGQEVRIAVIDSGISFHDDLYVNVLEGYNYLDSNTDVTDNIGHGTFASGLIAAALNEYGIRGVVPGAKLVPLKCFDTGISTKVSMVKAAIYDAVDIYKVNIINMSFGLTQYSSVLENAVNYAVDHGVIVVAAAGNTGTNTIYYPAGFQNVVGVGAVDSDGLVSSFSQKNDSVFVVAPGKNVIGTTNENDYGTKSGTSFSAPLVAGAIAFMMNIQSDIERSDVMDILRETSVDKGESGYDTSYGYGVISIKNIAEYMLDGIDYFLSPIDIDQNGSSIIVYNNTENPLKATVFINNYRKSALTDFETIDFEIEPQKCIKFSSELCANKIKCYLWKSISDISVIAMFREREAN